MIFELARQVGVDKAIKELIHRCFFGEEEVEKDVSILQKLILQKEQISLVFPEESLDQSKISESTVQGIKDLKSFNALPKETKNSLHRQVYFCHITARALEIASCARDQSPSIIAASRLNEPSILDRIIMTCEENIVTMEEEISSIHTAHTMLIDDDSQLSAQQKEYLLKRL